MCVCVCRKCVHRLTGKVYAVKIIGNRVDSSREVQLLRLCQGHDTIVKLQDVFHDEVRIPINLYSLRYSRMSVY